jgi:flagellar assembly factor FliW
MHQNSNRLDGQKSTEGDVIRFEEGILGFPDSHRYALIPHEPNSPFAWLQSLDQENLCFLLINPLVVKSDYVVNLPGDAASSLRLDSPSNGMVLAIVVVPEDARQMRMNLRAPIVINVQRRLGKQVVLEDSSLSIRHPVVAEKAQTAD